MKIEVKTGQNVYLTSDTHYNHFNLVSSITEWKDTRPGQTRDFKSLSHMNQTIVNNINSMVGEDDILIHFGDWSFGGIESIWEFRRQILCKNIYLIFGNHDEHIIANKELLNSFQPTIGRTLFAQETFTWCGHYEEFEIVYPQEKKNTKTPRYKFVAMHYPISSWNKLGKGRVHFHGHIHSLPQHKVNKRAMDVGLDGNNFFPYELRKAFSYVQDNQIGPVLIQNDHHVKE